MRLAHNLNRAFPHIALGHTFQPGALVLDVLYLQIQKGGQFAGERLIPLFVAVLHGLHRLVVGHIPDNKGHFLQPGQLAATAAAMACHNLIAVSVLFRAGKSGHHNAVEFDGCHGFLHFGIVPHLERMGTECMERVELGKFQIDQLSLLHRAGRYSRLCHALLRGSGLLCGLILSGTRGSRSFGSFPATSGQFVSL